MLGLGGTETEDGKEEYHQLPPHEAVSEDQGTDQAGQMKRRLQRAHGGKVKVTILYTETTSLNEVEDLRKEWLLRMYRKS